LWSADHSLRNAALLNYVLTYTMEQSPS